MEAVSPHLTTEGQGTGSCIGMDTNPFRNLGQVDQLEGEILEMRRSDPSSSRKSNESERRKCFNCRRVGHSFAACTAQENGILLQMWIA